MHEQHIVVLDCQRQGLEEDALSWPELVPGPGDRGLRIGVHETGGVADRCRIVVAEHHHCAIGRVAFDQVEHGHGIRPIADQVAQKGVAIRPQRSRVGKAGGNCLQVAVNVSEQGQLHWVVHSKQVSEPESVTSRCPPLLHSFDLARTKSRPRGSSIAHG